MAHFCNSLIKKITFQDQVHPLDILCPGAEAHNVQGDSERTGFVHTEEEKAHCCLQIPNGRVCGRQHISSPSYGVEGQEAKEMNLDLIQDKKNGFWHQALEA